MKLFPEYESFDAVGLAALVEKKIISPQELLNTAIERIEKYNPQINAVVHKFYDTARMQIQNTLPPGPFHGVPFLLKDLLADCEGTPLESGSRLTQGRISSVDSELVKRMKNTGLIILGKTNTPEFGLSPVTEPELHGPTHNPWNFEMSAGGSSGGSAAAVAAGMVPMAHASDAGGSIRIPSACCGVFGLKISRGIAPTNSPFVWQNMLVEHVITRSVRDSAAMLDALTNQKKYCTQLNQPLRPLRIAVSDTPPFASTVGETEKFFLKKTAQLCEQLGHHVEEISPPPISKQVPIAYMILLAAEISVGLDILVKSLEMKLDLSLVETPTALLYKTASQLSAKDFAWAMYVLESAGKYYATFFNSFDMLLTPVLPNGIPRVGALQPKKSEKLYLEMLRRLPGSPLLKHMLNEMSGRIFSLIPFTPMSNISGLPSMSVPLFMDKNHLPVGMHFIGKMDDEVRLLQFAAQLEEALPWKDRRPNLLQQ
ncbi:MAG: amidase family protein [Gammaproteobacteria bacterium]|nr:amidase family protein [Gammaproteobacteria bacterium]